MKNILTFIVAAVFVAGCATAGNAPKKLFTEKEFNANKGRVALECGDAYCRATVEYTAQKGLTMLVKPDNNAFSGLTHRRLPASAEPRTVVTTFKVDAPDFGRLMFSIGGGGKYDIRKLTVETVPETVYVPPTTVPDPARRKSKRHHAIKDAYAKAPSAPVVLFGDSLTDNWRGKCYEYMAKTFGAVNAGICGDRIEHLLWRIEDMSGLIATNQPSVATFMIGTNNFGFDNDPEDIAAGVANLVTTLRSLAPKTKIIVFSVPPRGFPRRDDVLPFPGLVNPLIEKAVADLAAAGDANVFYFDLSAYLADGNLLRKEFYTGDYLHFSAKGYGEVIEPVFAGAIRLVTAKNLPGDYMRKMAGWERYLKWRRAATVANFALEEALACETHLKALPGHWMQQFKTIEKDPAYKPEMPEEYIRQSKGEGLPPELR